MAGQRYLDTNILLRYFTNDVPALASRAKALLERIDQGAERVVLSDHIVFEVVFTLQRFYKVPKAAIREKMQDVVSLTDVQLRHKTVFFTALDIYVDYNVSFADAFSAALMQSRGDTEVYSWDTDFDKLPGITRLEP